MILFFVLEIIWMDAQISFIGDVLPEYEMILPVDFAEKLFCKRNY